MRPSARNALLFCDACPHTDLSQLDRLYKGDRTRMARWVGIYLEETPGQLQRLVACVERAELEGLLAIVHDLKPTMHYLRRATDAGAAGAVGAGRPGQQALQPVDRFFRS
ncbi:MAG: hypothetical protein IPO05_12210 [Flavobacteriales bacterium]|nr:hypothetical protein [Flavobacteriales bacterium]